MRRARPIVKTQAGDVQGVAERGVLAFKGIPFAAPPVGELRWREPRPPRPGKACARPQPTATPASRCRGCPEAIGGDPGPLSEDCLYLNVWTPKADPAANLPVMVWIHGGAYVFGSGSGNLYNGAPLANERRGRRHHQLPPRAARLLCPSRAGEGKSRRPGKLRPARPDRRAQVGAAEHRAVRRRSRQRHHLRSIRRRQERAGARSPRRWRADCSTRASRKAPTSCRMPRAQRRSKSEPRSPSRWG